MIDRALLRRLTFNEDLAGSPLPLSPTDALPGTVEKLLVMRERARRRWGLHHPLDATWGQAPRLCILATITQRNGMHCREGDDAAVSVEGHVVLDEPAARAQLGLRRQVAANKVGSAEESHG
jgi:hypothetical protein